MWHVLDEGFCSDWQLNIQVLRTVMMVWGFNWIFALVFGGGSGLLALGYYHTVPITPHNSPIFPHTIATLIQEVLSPVPPIHFLDYLLFRATMGFSWGFQIQFLAQKKPDFEKLHGMWRQSLYTGCLFLTRTPITVLSIRLHSKSHQKSSKCQNLITGWHLELLGG